MEGRQKKTSRLGPYGPPLTTFKSVKIDFASEELSYLASAGIVFLQASWGKLVTKDGTEIT